ncbi:MAG: TonB-dependent receptor plug domain-containing protein, partial [Bacteroidales bacterium]|nr:TonB-dependent receptor plug domain-containing protein [Bacteroidales bacterium]
MRRIIMLLLGMGLLSVTVWSQEMSELSGVVVDENNQTLPGAYVFLYPPKKATVTDANGRYLFNNIKSGNFRIEVTFVGYKTFTDSIHISGNSNFNISLSPATLSLQELVVTDHYAEDRKKESSLNVEIVNDDYLKKHQGGSLMKSLERLPGVSSIDIGSGQSKPVIRGLGFNRVVVVENGVKHEGQQWGADHGLEIDQYAIDDVEVVKGPASLMYGSDAIGGVIDIKQAKIPENNHIEGNIDLTGKSNNNLLGTSVALSGRKNKLFAG